MDGDKLLDFLNTAKTRMADGEYAQALQAFDAALGCDPANWLKIEIYFQTALCLCEISEHAAAAENLETALSLAKDMTHDEKKHIYELLRIAYRHKPDKIKLAELCRMLMGIEEDNTGLTEEYLSACFSLGRWDEMARTFDDFPDIDSRAEILMFKIQCFTRIGRYKEALAAADRYIESFGEDYTVCANLVELCYRAGDGKKGFEYYKKAIALCANPEWRLKVAGNLFSEDLYLGAISDGEFPDIVDDIRRITEKLQTNTVFDNTLKPFRKISLGYLSADLMRHPGGHFLLPVMVKTLNSHSFNICFNMTARHDDVTERFKSLADKWEEVYGCPDSQIENLFLTNKIDIAFDMMCHTMNNRIRLYARRLAPVQISWIGFPVTSGVAAMDYVITDKNTDPPGSEKYYTEKLLYMPDCFLCSTLSDHPQVEPPAFTRNGYITFACFHNLKKITDKTLRLWRGILETCGNSRLEIIGYVPAGGEDRELFNERVRRANLPMDRVNISPIRTASDYFAAYNDVDIMLDTYPFSGATTTVDALRMGRPIITLVGERHVTRVSYSLLKQVGLEDLAAFSEDEYVEKAAALSVDHERLLKINAELPRRVLNSPFTNQPMFRKNFEKIIRDVWIRHCFEKRAGVYGYGADSPPELLEQVVNATDYIEKKIDAGEGIDGALASEYYRVQKAYCEKLSLLTDSKELIDGYKKLVGMFGRRLGENDLRMAVATAKHYLNTFYNVRKI